MVFGACDVFFFFSSRRRHTRFKCDWSSDVCSSDLIGEGHGWQLDKMKARIGNGGVLTVGESKDFAARGGVVGMVTAEERVRLEINLTVAMRARLTISSRLLSMAHVIYEPAVAKK